MGTPTSGTHAKGADGLQPLLRDISGLREDPRNLRTHDGRSIEAITNALETFGQQKPLIVTEDGVVVAGNGTFRAAKLLGWRQIAVVVYDGSPEAARRFAIADNRTAELSGWDRSQLAKTVESLVGEDLELAHALGFSSSEVKALERLATGSISLSAEKDAEREARRQQENPHGEPEVHTWLVEFEREADHVLWTAFEARLGRQFPDAPSLGDALARFVETY